MKTTLNLDDALYRRAKIRAAEENCTVSQLIEEGLRIALDAKVRVSTPRRRVAIPLIEGGHPATAGKEMTPEKTAAILLAQEAKWARDSG